MKAALSLLLPSPFAASASVNGPQRTKTGSPVASVVVWYESRLHVYAELASDGNNSADW